MLFAIAVVVPLAALLLWALYAERPAPESIPMTRAAWVGLPSPMQVRRTDFPRSVAGYDRAAVDAHLAKIAGAISGLAAGHTADDEDQDIWPAELEPTPAAHDDESATEDPDQHADDVHTRG